MKRHLDERGAPDDERDVDDDTPTRRIDEADDPDCHWSAVAARKALLEDLREELKLARERLRTCAPRLATDWTITVAVLEDRVRALEEAAPCGS